MILTLLTVSALATLPAANPQDPDCAYRVALKPLEDRTELVVAMRFRGNADGPTEIQLPADRYGTPKLWEFVTELRADGARLREIVGTPSRRLLEHQPGAAITLHYKLTFDPQQHVGVAYRPSVGPSHFHFFDPQWRSRVLGRDTPQRYQLAFDTPPSGWTVFSNLGDGPGPYTSTTTETKFSAFIAGGDYHQTRFKIRGQPVGVYVRGFADVEPLAASVRSIIEYQGQTFGSFAGTHYVVSISPRARIRAGTAIRGAFVCLADAESAPENLEVLIAHEYFHTWLPRTGTIESWRSGTALDEFRFDWFLEGFTEYLARRMLLDSGRYSMDQFVERFNDDLAEQARNPMRSASLETVDAAITTGTYTNRHERTSYFRGPLMALIWDQRLRAQGKHDLYDVIRTFLSAATDQDGALEEDAFFDLLEGFQLDARERYDRHIVRGEPVALAPSVFGAAYEATEMQVTDANGQDATAHRFDAIR